MNTIPQFTIENGLALKAILDAPDRGSHAMSYYQTTGFLFVVACSPELVNPNQWIPVVMDHANSEEADLARIEKTMGLLVGLYNEINRQVQESDVSLPAGCEFYDDMMANFEDGAPIHDWSVGFAIGHDWQKNLMSQYTPAELSEELGFQMMVLRFFASSEIALAFIEKSTKEGLTIESMAEDMRGIFPDALTGYAHLAKTIQTVLAESKASQKQSTNVDKTGRNEPCPCGSGKKYKKCCGSVLH